MFDTFVVLRLYILFCYTVSLTGTFRKFINFLFQPTLITAFFDWIVSPLSVIISFLVSDCFLYILQTMWSITRGLIYIVSDVLYPIIWVVCEIFKLIGSLLKLILYTPSISFLKVLTYIKDGLYSTFLIAKDLSTVIKKFVLPVA